MTSPRAPNPRDLLSKHLPRTRMVIAPFAGWATFWVVEALGAAVPSLIGVAAVGMGDSAGKYNYGTLELLAGGLIHFGRWAGTLAVPASAAAAHLASRASRSASGGHARRITMQMGIIAAMAFASFAIGETPTNTPPAWFDLAVFGVLTGIWSVPCLLAAVVLQKMRS